jgi:hypothetical protein
VIDGYTNIPLFDSHGTTRFTYWIINNMFFFESYILDAFGNLLSTLPTQPNPMRYIGQDGYYTDATGLDSHSRALAPRGSRLEHSDASLRNIRPAQWPCEYDEPDALRHFELITSHISPAMPLVSRPHTPNICKKSDESLSQE